MPLYRLMIVDDEFAIREGMMSYDWGRWGFEAVASAPSGRRALEHMEWTHIDLVITDIRMPGMDGLTLAREINARYPDCVVIILTGYQDFEYAKSAIQAGVLDYLLKPVDMMRSADVFERARAELERRLRQRDFLEHAAPIAIDALVSNILHGKLLMNEDTARALAALDISLEAPGYSVSCFSLPEDRALDEPTVARTLRESGLPFFSCFVVSMQHVFFVLNMIAERDTQETRQRLIRQAGAQLHALHTLLAEDAAVYTGIGDVVQTLAEVEKSRQQATHLARKARFSEDAGIHTLWQSKQIRADYPEALAQAVCEAILVGCEAEAANRMADFMNALLLHYYALNDVLFEELVTRFMREVDGALEGQGISWQSVQVPPNYQVFLRRHHHFRQVCDIMVEKSRALALAQAIRRGDITPTAFRAIQQTKQYINANYDKKITMADMAKRVYMNSSYFSVLFKKETSKNFMDYLTEVRMEQAKRLLAEANEHIYEIGYRVGYPNPRYFSDAFRKYEGVSPQEYREGLLAGRAAASSKGGR